MEGGREEGMEFLKSLFSSKENFLNLHLKNLCSFGWFSSTYLGNTHGISQQDHTGLFAACFLGLFRMEFKGSSAYLCQSEVV